MAGIYIHIPYCTKACHYCDFHFSTSRQDQNRMVVALQKEMEMRHEYLDGSVIQTVYFGGGTPSVLSPEQLNGLLHRIRQSFRIVPDAEITLEANPEDLSKERLEFLQSIGVNRLSIGIQTLHDATLSALNRAHDSRQARQAVDDARKTGFTNLSLDIMFGIPGRSPDVLRADLSEMIAFRPEHISAYGLTIEERTVLGKRMATGAFIPVSDDDQAAEFELVMDMMEVHGYRQYEVSNFCRPGFESRHNSAYWTGSSYLGIGPGAHSFNGISRQANVSSNQRYMSAVEEGIVPAEVEELSVKDRIHEYILTTLRTEAGCSLQYLHQTFGYDLSGERSAYLSRLQASGHAILGYGKLILTRKGRMIADRIASDLFLSD